MKYLVLFGVLLAVYLVVRAGRSGGDAGRPRTPRRPPAPPPAAAPQDMVRCASCGLHLPRNEALVDARGRAFCCPEHRDLGA